MKRILSLLLLSISCAFARDPEANPTPAPDEASQEEPRGPRPPKSPIMEALDTNRDHKIDKEELADASEALRQLDKNGDGELTPDEFKPKPPKENGDDEMTPSERRRQERQERRESRQQGGQQQGQRGGGPGGPGGPPPPPGR